jgi:hypothetical protein
MTLPSGRSPLRPYGVFGRLYPILVLHACLLPLNVFRLRQVRGVVQAVRTASDEDALQALVPYMRTESHAAGEMLFRRGDPADKLYMIQRGVRVVSGNRQARRGRVTVRRGGPPRSARHALADGRVPRRLPAVDDHEGQGARALLPAPDVRDVPPSPLSDYALDHAVAGGRTSPAAGGRGRSPSGASTSSRWSDVEDS